QSLKDLCMYDIPSSMWGVVKQRGSQPGPRSGHSAAVVGRYMYLFGGTDGRRTFNDLYRLDCQTLMWDEIELPNRGLHARSGQASGLTGVRWFIHGGWCTRGFSSDLHALDTVKVAEMQVQLKGGPYSSADFTVKVTFAKEGKPPPISVQWYRAKPGEPFEKIAGANELVYNPNADDIKCQLGVACMPCRGNRPLGVSYFRVTRPVEVDPKLGQLVHELITNTYAEFRVKLLKTDVTDFSYYTLLLGLDFIKLKEKSRTRLKDTYRKEFKIILSKTQPNTFVMSLHEGTNLPMAVEHTYERDLVALVARGFWAMNREKWKWK
ncbi:hypothetical protein CYMTET_29711, partial [Cymbomonas tetramitiformis]